MRIYRSASPWVWLGLVALILGPWWLRYLAWVLGGCGEFWMPLR